MKTYVLGTESDRIVTVKKSDGDYVVTIRVKDADNKYIVLPPKRWAAFRLTIEDVNKNIKDVREGNANVKFQQHIGGGHYISVTSGYDCVDLRKFYQPYDSKDGAIRATKRGVALRLEEWVRLCDLVDVINTAHPSLGTALPCYYEDDHMNQFGWLNCLECHPFHTNLSQLPTDKTA